MRLGVLALVLSTTAAGQGSLILNPDPTCCTRFGFSVAVDQGLIVVAEAPINPGPFDVHVYELATEHLIATFPLGTSEHTRIVFEEGYLFVSDYTDFSPGKVHALDRTSGTWDTINSLTTHTNFFGAAMDYDRGVLAVGAPTFFTQTDAGSVSLYDADTRALIGTLDPVHPNTRSMGVGVAMGAGRIFVGDLADVNGVVRRGVVEVFDAQTLAHLHTIEPDLAMDIGWFGGAIAANDDYLVVGAPYSNEYAFFGGVVFVYDATTGQLLHVIEPEGAEQFGVGLELDGSTIAAGYFTGFGHWGGVRTYDAATGAELQRFISPISAPVGAGEPIAIGDGHVISGLPTHDISAGGIVVYDLDPHLGTPYCAPEPNSSNFPGRLRALGSLSVSADDFELRADQLPLNEFCLFLNSPVQGFVPNAGGSSGNQCVIGQVGMHRSAIGRVYLDGTHRRSVDLAALPRPGGTTHAIQPGETWNFQAWHRDGSTSNFTDAITVTFE